MRRASLTAFFRGLIAYALLPISSAIRLPLSWANRAGASAAMRSTLAIRIEERHLSRSVVQGGVIRGFRGSQAVPEIGIPDPRGLALSLDLFCDQAPLLILQGALIVLDLSHV